MRYDFRWVLLMALSAGYIAPQGHADELGDQIRLHAQPYIESKTVDGLSIGVICGKESATVHLGNGHGDSDAPSSQTLYEIGSISKVFTGLLLADAVIKQKLRLGQPAQDLLPSGVTLPVWEQTPITLLHIITHRSGLPRLPSNMPSLTSSNPYGDYTAALAHEFISSHKLDAAPGTKSEYSNFAMSLLGHMLADHASTTYEALLEQRITKPLGMNDTAVTLNADQQTRLATPHIGVGVPTNPWTFADLPGAGGIRSTVGDMLKFAQANLTPPNDETGQAIELAWRKHVDSPPMGLAWNFAGDGSSRWHNGQTGGFHSMLIINREAQVAVVVLANTATMEVDQLATDLVGLLAGQPKKPRVFEKIVQVKPEVMKRYEGKYQLAPSFVFTVTVNDNRLMVGLTGQPTLEVFPRSDTEWFYKVVDATLTFKVNKKGECEAVELFQNGVRQTANRISK